MNLTPARLVFFFRLGEPHTQNVGENILKIFKKFFFLNKKEKKKMRSRLMFGGEQRGENKWPR